MNVTKQHYSPAAHRLFLIHTGALASYQAATVLLSQWAESVYTMCLRNYPPVFVDKNQGRVRHE